MNHSVDYNLQLIPINFSGKQYVAGGILSAVALNYLVDLFGVCVLIGVIIGVAFYTANSAVEFYEENRSKYDD